MSNKQLWLLAGGNGAGKSTFYHTQLEHRGLPFVNADIIAKELYPDAPETYSYQAALIAEKLRYELIEEGRSFCFESVFSHSSKLDFIADAKSRGYEIVLVFIHLDSPMLNKARIAQRIEAGGHAVPDDKVETRIPRTMQHMKTAIMLADKAYLLDNSSNTNPYQVVARIEAGTLHQMTENLPDWVSFVLS